MAARQSVSIMKDLKVTRKQQSCYKIANGSNRKHHVTHRKRNMNRSRISKWYSLDVVSISLRRSVVVL